MQKITFEEFQNHGSVMISLPRLQHRFQVTKEKLEAAGFKNISIVKGVDGFNDDIEPLLQKPLLRLTSTKYPIWIYS